MNICPECEENELFPEQIRCYECESNEKYLENYIRRENKVKGRFCKICGSPIGKGKQLCDTCRESRQVEYYRKYAETHSAERSEYWKKYQRKNPPVRKSV